MSGPTDGEPVDRDMHACTHSLHTQTRHIVYSRDVKDALIYETTIRGYCCCNNLYCWQCPHYYV